MEDGNPREKSWWEVIVDPHKAQGTQGTGKEDIIGPSLKVLKGKEPSKSHCLCLMLKFKGLPLQS